MSISNVKFPKLTEDCLKDNVRRTKIFTLKTNLSELGGPGVNFLSESLMLYSMQKANKRIIELIMYENQYVFRTPESIKKIMRDDWPVMQSFLQLGNHDIHCDLTWLIYCLYRLGELLPLKDILYGAPPLITKRSPNQKNTIQPGDTIYYEVKTVSKADITWWKSDSNGCSAISHTIQMEPCSIKTVSYKTKSNDQGWFYIVVTSLGLYHEKGDKIFVGEVQTEPYVQAYAEFGINNPIKRVALLIGIMEYSEGHNLTAPKHDIAKLDPILRKIGFTVFSFADLNLQQLNHVLNMFSDRYVHNDTYIFFYFAGHGMSQNKKDFVQLTGPGEKLEIIEILNILSINKPKIFLTIFDMCRNDSKNQPLKEINITEASLPISESLMLVMSTFPLEKAFEMKKKFESHSQIIRPLCHCLMNFACNTHINIAILQFVNDPSITGQKPVFYSGPMPYILGNEDFFVPEFRSSIKWLGDTVSLDYNFDVYHNKLKITLDRDSNDYFISSDFNLKGLSGMIKTMVINMFDLKQFFDEEQSLNLKVHRFAEFDGVKKTTVIPFKIILPSDIVHFF